MKTYTAKIFCKPGLSIYVLAIGEDAADAARRAAIVCDMYGWKIEEMIFICNGYLLSR